MKHSAGSMWTINNHYRFSDQAIAVTESGRFRFSNGVVQQSIGRCLDSAYFVFLGVEKFAVGSDHLDADLGETGAQPFAHTGAASAVPGVDEQIDQNPAFGGRVIPGLRLGHRLSGLPSGGGKRPLRSGYGDGEGRWVAVPLVGLRLFVTGT